jgi:hypothetical protein
MDRKVLIFTLAFFTAVLLVGIFWNDILEQANPSPPRLVEVSLERGLSHEPEVNGTYFIEGGILSDCAVAFTYDTPEVGSVDIYELDTRAYNILSGKNIAKPCSTSLIEGTIKLRFDQPLDSLSVSIWIGRTADNGESIYFQLLGTWRITDNQSVVFLHPNPESDYKLMSFPELKALVNQSGLYPVKP